MNDEEIRKRLEACEQMLYNLYMKDYVPVSENGERQFAERSHQMLEFAQKYRESHK